MKKELETKKDAPPPALAEALGKFAGMGFESMTMEDAAVPYLMILQSQSPQVKKGHPNRIEGAEEGDLFNSVTQRVYKGGVRLIPCGFRKAWVEWVPKTAGGGFVASYDTDARLAECKKDPVTGRDMLPNGHHLVATAYHYVLVVDEGGNAERVVISMASTQLKKSRRWNSQMMALLVDTPSGKLPAPPFAFSYQAGTVLEQKDQNSWFGWNIVNPEQVTDAGLFNMAVKFWQDVGKGAVKVAEPAETASEPAPASSEHF